MLKNNFNKPNLSVSSRIMVDWFNWLSFDVSICAICTHHINNQEAPINARYTDISQFIEVQFGLEFMFWKLDNFDSKNVF